MDAPYLPDSNGLLTAWRGLSAHAESDQGEPYELDEWGVAVTNACPSARRQIVLTDIFCQLTEQIGHLAGMLVSVTTSSFGIRVPDVVWMPPEKWETFDRGDPVPFVPDLCVEVLLDSERTHHIGRRVKAYLDGGAIEVIVVGQYGQVEFWGAKGRQQASTLGMTLSLDSMYFDEWPVSSILSGPFESASGSALHTANITTRSTR